MQLINKLFLAVIIIVASSYNQFVHANERYWAELGLGGPNGTLHGRLKYATEDIDRATDLGVDSEIDVVSVLKTWNRSEGLWYADAGIGLGFASGKLGENCRKEGAGFGTRQICDISDISDIGIPIQLTASVGKIVGVGVGLSAFLSEEIQEGTFSVFLLIGNFP